jgi:type IV pilus assembly protein PilW
MTMPRSFPTRGATRQARGLSLVELLVALSLGLILVVGMASVYLFTKGAFARQSQVSTLQQSVRTAFEYLGNDARMVGHLGCFTGGTGTFKNDITPITIANNYGVGIEGYEYDNATAGAFTLASDAPANETNAAKWKVNGALATSSGTPINTLPLTTVSSTGLTPGSDVLVIRSVVGTPVRLTSDTVAAGTTAAIENIPSGKCSTGTDKVSGLCAGSHGLIASCTAARVFSVTSIAGGTLTMPAPAVSYSVFPAATSEVFPMETVVYYVKQSSSGTTTSLYRRIFNGDPTANASVEQELIEDVESLQVRYGYDSTAPTPDGAIDAYFSANAVPDWSQVVTVRMSLLLRSATVVPKDVALPASAPVNDVTITYPTGSRYDRRVFTTTVAIRNKIAYF